MDPHAPEAEGVTQQVHQMVAAAAEVIAGSRVAVEILQAVGPAVTGKGKEIRIAKQMGTGGTSLAVDGGFVLR